MEKYESTYKLLSSQSRRERIEGVMYHPAECTATRMDIDSGSIADLMGTGCVGVEGVLPAFRDEKTAH